MINGQNVVDAVRVAPGYEPLMSVLVDAFDQAAHGKGKERHAGGEAFADQPMQKLIALYGRGFALGQAAKKSQESQRLPYERARAELLGAICYLAGAVIALDREAAAVFVANDNSPAPRKCVRADGCPFIDCAQRGACQG